ncbi:hypothetical protein EDD15DRAFT_2533149 [Pisolithus albus]|nr:hypothetical protein EDD15DRAFT_2533149 [Pisolithus albus]
MPHLGAEGIGHCDERLVLLSYHRVTNGGQLAPLLHTQGTSKAAQAPEQAQRQSETAWHDQIRARRREDELVCKAGEAKRREQNIQTEDLECAESQRETRRAREKVRNAQRTSNEVAEKARATQVAAEKAEREAAEYRCAAREVQEEAEKRLQKGPKCQETLDDAPLSTSTVPRARVTAEGAALRDQSGRLDFQKICSMFEGKDHAESQGGIPVGAGEMDRRILDSPGGGTQADVGDTNISKENPITASVQDSRPDRSEYPDVDGAVPSNDVPPLRDILTMPYSFDQLNDALGSARDEMHTLRRQYDELQQLVGVRLGKGKDRNDGTKAAPQIAIGGGSEHGAKQDEETRRALTARVSILAITRMTNVPPHFYFLEILVLPLSNVLVAT